MTTRQARIAHQSLIKIARMTGLFLALVLTPGLVQASAYLSDFTISADVDRYTYAPKAPQNQFNADVAEIWASAFINSAPAGTIVEADWRYLREGSYQKMLGSRLEAEGDRYFAARIQPNDGATLPSGDYRVIFKLNGEQQGSVDFVIASSKIKQNQTRTSSTHQALPSTR